ncbi:MAG: sigma-70 family RNA polymerase sigma factor [Bacteroidales bacterium]|nr:sigma-70 family RNA polymerase sigma factor [Bacteroidales bacterium]MDD4213308.1 sigma-70 family RNA polymerase sigma factor [Bacteroidales bacterium]
MLFFKKSKSEKTELLPDQELIELYRKTNDTVYIGELFDRYVHLVYGIAYKYFEREDDRREAVMQVFDRLYEALKEHEITNFKAWLYSVAKNHCLMILRKDNTVTFNDQIQLKNFQQDFMDFEGEMTLNHINDEILDKKLPEAIKKLSDEQRICIELFYLHEKSYQEVVETTNFSLNQVKSYIQNGKRNLKIMLENNR